MSDGDDEEIDIPVRRIGPFGLPVIVGRAIFEDTKHMRIEFVDHEFVEEFHNLEDLELVVNISVKTTKDGRDEDLLAFLKQQAKKKLSDI